jgi:acetylornithine deacetylase/succinyl-diaminopimelate desuccinylase-like protein
VADEEATGTYGAQWLTEHHWDEVAADYVLTEFGGVPADLPAGRRLVIATSEKGLAWRRLVVRGTPGHGSMPWASDNALLTAAEVVRRLQAPGLGASISDAWRAFVEAMGLPEEFDEILLDPGRVREAFELLDVPTARYCHAATHTTFSPNVLHGGTKTNVIPDRVELDVDVRTLPGVSSEDVDAMLADLLGDLGDRVEVTAPFAGREATQSPTDTPLYEALCRRVEAAHPGASAAPWMNVGATDAAFFRQRGVVAYGAGLFGPNTSLQEFSSRFHGHDERVDVESLGLSTQLWLDLVDDLLT